MALGTEPYELAALEGGFEAKRALDGLEATVLNADRPVRTLEVTVDVDDDEAFVLKFAAEDPVADDGGGAVNKKLSDHPLQKSQQIKHLPFFFFVLNTVRIVSKTLETYSSGEWQERYLSLTLKEELAENSHFLGAYRLVIIRRQHKININKSNKSSRSARMSISEGAETS